MYAAKAIVAAVGTVVTVLSAAFADNVLDNSEIGGIISTIVVGILTVVAVYRVPNQDV